MIDTSPKITRGISAHVTTLQRTGHPSLESPPRASALNRGFRILSLSSHVALAGIGLPFEPPCHRHADELVIIAARLTTLGKKGLSLRHTSCPLKRPTERWLRGPRLRSLPFEARLLLVGRVGGWGGCKATIPISGPRTPEPPAKQSRSPGMIEAHPENARHFIKPNKEASHNNKQRALLA
ncbi:unnamed protein product [Arctogadus glacialis]